MPRIICSRCQHTFATLFNLKRHCFRKHSESLVVTEVSQGNAIKPEAIRKRAQRSRIRIRNRKLWLKYKVKRLEYIISGGDPFYGDSGIVLTDAETRMFIKKGYTEGIVKEVEDIQKELVRL
jgi:hypothetical protein